MCHPAQSICKHVHCFSDHSLLYKYIFFTYRKQIWKDICNKVLPVTFPDFTLASDFSLPGEKKKERERERRGGGAKERERERKGGGGVKERERVEDWPGNDEDEIIGQENLARMNARGLMHCAETAKDSWKNPVGTGRGKHLSFAL